MFSDMVRGVRVLKGTGIRYGGTKSVNDTMHAWPMMKKSEAPVVSVVPPVQGKPDPFLTPEFTSESLPSSPVPIPRGTR